MGKMAEVFLVKFSNVKPPVADEANTFLG